MSLLQIRHLVKRYAGLLATDHLDLDVAAGEIHAIIGPNGAGKTTLVQQISGVLRPDSGNIYFDGQDITSLAMHQRVQQGLARSYQITQIFPGLSVLENLALAIQARSGSSMRFWRAASRDSAILDEARELAVSLGLQEQLSLDARQLAHGQQRQLEFALALATKPRLLLLDEPMAGMGQEESALLLPHIQALRGTVAVLLIEHDMHAVFSLAQRISVLVAGRIIASDTPDAIRQHPDVIRAYLGDSLTEVA